MTQAFMTVLDMSLKAGYVILAVYLVRFILQTFGYPRRYSYLLWGIVLLRLLLPVSYSSSLSRIPDDFSQSIATEWADDYVGNTHLIHENSPLYDTAVDHGIRPVIDNFGRKYVVTGEDRVSPPKTVESELFPTLTTVWVTGICSMLLWNGCSLLRLRKRVREAIPLDHQIYLSDQVDTAFVLGILQPHIYLPAALSEFEREHILRHERYHIHRHDHRMKLLFFLLLCIHWFNPLVWMAYILAVRDMELSCDEAVTAELTEQDKADYAQTLLNLTAGHKRFHAAPVAFGEGDTAERIRHVFRYRTPPKWVCALAVSLVVFTAVGLLTDPKTPAAKQFGAAMYGYERIAYADYSDSNSYAPPNSFCLTTDNIFWVMDSQYGWEDLGAADLYTVTADEINAMMPYRLTMDKPPAITKVTDAKIIRFNNDNGQHLFYLLTRHKDGSRYIAYGYSDSEFYEPDRMTIRSLFPVSSGVGKMSSNGPFYQRCLVSMLEDAVDVFSTYHAGDGWQIVGFRTGIPKTDYGWALFRVEDNMVTFTGQMELFENAVEHNNGILLCSFPAVCNETGTITDKDAYDVVLIANPDVVEMKLHLLLNEQETITVYPHSQAPQMNIIPWEKTKHSNHVMMTFYDKNGNLVPGSPEQETALSLTERLEGLIRATEESGDRHFALGRIGYMTDLAEAYLADPMEMAKTDLPNGIKEISVFRGNHDIVQFSVHSFGSQYSGYYYSPDDVPVPFQNAEIPLTETEDGWAWQDNGDNHGTTKRITKCWFRYEANL